MKQRYSKYSLFFAFFTLLFYLPDGIAQCLCSDGSVPLKEEHTISALNFPSNTNTPVSIPQFQPATGTLICVGAEVFLTSVLRMKLENDDVVPINYIVRYSRSDSLTGPGISPAITGNLIKDYGPFPLAKSDGVYYSGPDYKVIPPDTVYKNRLYSGTTSNVASYLGSGNITFNYKATVNTAALGSDYYVLTINSQNKLDFHVTYSYCSNIVLKLNLKNFQAILKDKDNVQLSWASLNENKSNNYEIQISDNGISFKTIGTTPTKFADGASAEYDYQYHLDQSAGGKIYFRIKQTEGKSFSYSDIRVINLGNDAFPGLRIYPNPIVNNLNLEFDRPLSGEFKVELINQGGQVVYSTNTRLTNTPSLQIQIKNPPPPGIYYLKAKQSGSEKIYSGKLLFTK